MAKLSVLIARKMWRSACERALLWHKLPIITLTRVFQFQLLFCVCRVRLHVCSALERHDQTIKHTHTHTYT